jgi:hypothetical protein
MLARFDPLEDLREVGDERKLKINIMEEFEYLFV